MHSIEILEHTADIGIRARADTMAELFASMAMGLESIALEVEQIEPRHSSLDAKRMVMARFDIEHLNNEAVVAQGWGEPWDLKRHRTGLVVKAATYHQLKIARDAEYRHVGRLLSRAAAKKGRNAKDEQRLADAGILVRSESRDGILDEIPEAYIRMSMR